MSFWKRGRGTADHTLFEATFWVMWAAVLYRIGYALTHRVLMLEVLAKPRLVPRMAVKAKIRSTLAGEGISDVG